MSEIRRGCGGLWLISPAELASYSKKSTISSREIQTAVRLILPGELAKHAISEGTKSVTKVRIQPSVVERVSEMLIGRSTVLQRGSEVNLSISRDFLLLLYCILYCLFIIHPSRLALFSQSVQCLLLYCVHRDADSSYSVATIKSRS